MQPRGYNGVIIARGAIIDVTEPWASRFLADGTCQEEATAGKAPKAEPETEVKPKAKGKKK